MWEILCKSKVFVFSWILIIGFVFKCRDSNGSAKLQTFQGFFCLLTTGNFVTLTSGIPHYLCELGTLVISTTKSVEFPVTCGANVIHVQLLFFLILIFVF